MNSDVANKWVVQPVLLSHCTFSQECIPVGSGFPLFRTDKIPWYFHDFSRFHVIFPWYLLNFSKFHDISRFSRCSLIFPRFPGRVGALRMCASRFSGCLYRRWGYLPLGYGGGGCLPLGPEGVVYHTCPLDTPLDPHWTHPLSTHPREQNDWQTGVKTLPCPKLRLRAGKSIR